MSIPLPDAPRFWWLCLLGLAVLLRLGVMLARPEQLTQDRDLYLGIASELREGHGYSTPGSHPPSATAFRPPLYPLLLSALNGSAIAVGGLHLFLAGLMVWATGRAAANLGGGDGKAQFLAGGIVACDPLLLLYSGQPMTETLCSCGSALLIWVLLFPGEKTPRRAILEGLLWGLCFLSRPTYAVPLGLWMLGLLARCFCSPCQTETLSRVPRLRNLSLVVMTSLVVLSPWVFRNWSLFGQPILTTTHGGYTLWLANNPVYYREVVEGNDPVWNGDSLNRWQTETNDEMDRLRIHGEVARDQWEGARAKQFIRDNPWRFMRACFHRAAIFWSIFPGRSADTRLPQPMLLMIAGAYTAVWVGGVVAVWRLWKQKRWGQLGPLLALILGFCLVHLVYWTDARMRAPIIPAIAVLVTAGFARPHRSESA